MKRKLLAVAAGIALAPAVLCAAAFEGRVTFKMTSGRGQSQELSYALKSGKIRLEMPGERGSTASMIIDPVKRETIMIRDEERMYMMMPMAADPAAPAGKGGDDAKVEKTGETEKILGYTAEKYVSKSQDSVTEMWLAEGIGTFVGPGASARPMAGGGRRGAAPAAQAWERALAGKALFPLRVVTRDDAGKETFKMEATRVDKQALPDSMFMPPADYQKFDMGEMMKGAGGLPGMMRKKG